MQTCRSTLFLLMAVGMFVFAPATWAATSAAGSTSTQQLPAQHESADRLPAVALSYDGQYLAWIAPRHGRTELVLASGSAGHPHTVAIPGDCDAEGIRWARRWNELAMLARCAAGPGDTKPVHEAIWLLDVNAGTPPRKLADIAGLAQGLQWTSDGRQIAFLYRPAAPFPPEKDHPASPQAGAAGIRSVVVAVPVSGKSLQVLTPTALYVHEFRLSTFGHAIAYTATPISAGDPSTTPPGLYSQQAIANATPTLVFDPATAPGSLRDLQITQPRWPLFVSGQIFFLGKSTNARGTVGSDLYFVVASGSTPQNLTRQNRVKPAWFTFLRRGLLVTQIVNGETQVAGYRVIAGTWAKQTALLFSVPGAITDGRAPSAISNSYYPGRRPRVAYFQRVSAQATPVLHVGLMGTQPPPAVASTNAIHLADSSLP